MKRTTGAIMLGILAGILLSLALPAAARAAGKRPAPGQERAAGYTEGYSDGYARGYADALAKNAPPDSLPERRKASRKAPQEAPRKTLREVPREVPRETVAESRSRTVHQLGGGFRPEYIFPTNPFLKGMNDAGKPLDLSLSAHLRYSFRAARGSCTDLRYGGAYQGIGAAYYSFGNRRELGNPAVIYLFQGGRIARINRKLSFNYEWNLGLSFGWKPYDHDSNRYNQMMGSKLNALINVDFYLQWTLTRHLDLTTGIALTHFSNGNTKIPNAGLNSGGMKVGLTYNFSADGDTPLLPRRAAFSGGFPRHMSYDLVLFGSWRRKGVQVNDKQVASPDAYTVVGFNFAAMYNLSYKFRTGLSLDGVYDGSANVYRDYDVNSETGYVFRTPSIDKQLALGISARAEFVMPYFTIGFGLGYNVLHKGGDLKAFYQMLTLKIGVTRSSFLHIGYSLKDFHMPNFLMLGVGYRFNNKYPRHD